MQFRLKMKREELEHYKNVPNMRELRENRFKVQFTGVEIYEKYYEYCKEKGKCSFCSKLISESELKHLKIKMDKRIEKSSKQI